MLSAYYKFCGVSLDHDFALNWCYIWCGDRVPDRSHILAWDGQVSCEPGVLITKVHMCKFNCKFKLMNICEYDQSTLAWWLTKLRLCLKKSIHFGPHVCSSSLEYDLFVVNLGTWHYSHGLVVVNLGTLHYSHGLVYILQGCTVIPIKTRSTCQGQQK